MKNVPKDVLHYVIAPQLPLEDLNRLCRTQKKWASVCRDPEMWKRRPIEERVYGLEHARRLGDREMESVFKKAGAEGYVAIRKPWSTPRGRDGRVVKGKYVEPRKHGYIKLPDGRYLLPNERGFGVFGLDQPDTYYTEAEYKEILRDRHQAEEEERNRYKTPMQLLGWEGGGGGKCQGRKKRSRSHRGGGRQ